MRAIFGVVSLLIVLAIVGMVAVKQMKSSSQAMSAAAVPATTVQTGAAAPSPVPAGNVREQSQQLQQRVRDDVARALEQGAAARRSEAEK
ncbi:MAG: hypothetical protein ABIX46_04070 [Burkholderiaceae bacterium]